MTTATKPRQRVALREEDVKALFETKLHQNDVLIGIYRLVVPDFDRLQAVNGWPSVNNDTWQEIALLFVEFDQKHHPDVFAGGLWLNRGFSTAHGDRLRNWEASLKGVELVYGEGQPC